MLQELIQRLTLDHDMVLPIALAAIVVVMIAPLFLSGCADNPCGETQCRDSESRPRLIEWARLEYTHSGGAEDDTTYLTVRCRYNAHPPDRFCWSITVGTFGPVVRRLYKCALSDSSYTCVQWDMEETVAWFPPMSDDPVLALFQVRFPDWDEVKRLPVEQTYVGFAWGCGGHVVSPFVVRSRPAGAAVFLDGRDTGTTTRAVLCIRDWWEQHLVRVELAPYRPESTIVAVTKPCRLDSTIFTLTGIQ